MNGTLVPSADARPCPLRLPELDDEGLDRVTNAYEGRHEQIGVSRYATTLHSVAGSLEHQLGENKPESWFERQLAELRAPHPAPALDFTLVIDQLEDSQVAGEHFRSGHYAGTLYVYDARARRVVCAGHADATNSAAVRTVELRGNPRFNQITGAMSVQRDLEHNTVRDGLRNLVSVE